MTLRELLDSVREELPQCELTSVVSLQTGLSLAASGSRPAVDAATADAFSGELYRLIANLFPEERPDDVVVRGPSHVFVSTRLDDTGYFWHLSTRAEVTLGFTQAVMRKYQQRVTDAVGTLLDA